MMSGGTPHKQVRGFANAKGVPGSLSEFGSLPVLVAAVKKLLLEENRCTIGVLVGE